MKSDKTLLFHSTKYRALLKSFLKQDDCYLILVDGGQEILGVLPTFIFKNDRYGNVINSLPFYGSNGGIIEFNDNHEAKRELATAFKKLAESMNCAASTIISSPFETAVEFYENNLDYDFKEKRIGQITSFEDGLDREGMMAIFHYKTRNMIRKAMKFGVQVRINNGKSAFGFLVDTHKENITQIGGIAKEGGFFESIQRIFEGNKDYKLYTAYSDDKPVAALLLFYFNKTVEYFTPVVKAEFRSFQPLSLLIFEAMKDALDNGYKYWNWGGTWLSQTGLYRFKKRWGTKDYPYYYYTKIYNTELLSLSKQELLREYPYFYVCPFDKLNG
jgi:hypothetical protein